MAKAHRRQFTATLGLVAAALAVALALAPYPAAGADPPSFRLDVDAGSVFAPNAAVTLTVQGCDCAAVSNGYGSAIAVEVDGRPWRTLAANAEDRTCGCLPTTTSTTTSSSSSAEAAPAPAPARVEVKDAATNRSIGNASMAVGSFGFFVVSVGLDPHDPTRRPLLSVQPVSPAVILNCTVPNDPDGEVNKGWFMQPKQILNGRVGKFQIPVLPAGASVALGSLVRVTVTMGLVGEVYPDLPLPVDPAHPADFALSPYYTAAGPAFAGAGTVLTVAGRLMPGADHVALLQLSTGARLTTRPAKSDPSGAAVHLEVPAAIDDQGLTPGEFNILLQELRYAGAADGQDPHLLLAQMGTPEGPFVFKYQTSNPPHQPTPAPTQPAPHPASPPQAGAPAPTAVFLGIGGALAAGTGLFLYQRRRRRYSEIAGRQ